MSDATPSAQTGGSITNLLELVKGGDPAAAGPLWEVYFTRLVGLARAKLNSAPPGANDPNAVAASAFLSFCIGAEAGRFSRLDDRTDLWQVLFMLTTRKAIVAVRRENAVKRGGGTQVERLDGSDGMLQLIAKGPTPEEESAGTEECRRLLGLLGSDELRKVAVWKMEGHSNAEIATEIGRSVPTVERKLAAIRTIWEREVDR
jgi:DNA-directed RNA polymerase specialized sigma24 family protein